MKRAKRAVEHTIGEIIIVAIGLFIGFQFDSWKDNWQDRQAQKAVLRSIASDLDRDTSLLQVCLKEAESAAQSAQKLLLQLDVDNPISTDSVGQLIQPLFSYVDVPLNRASFELFTNSGKITLFKDPALERKLHSYYQRIAKIYDTWNEWDRTWSASQLMALRQLSFDRVRSMSSGQFQVKETFWLALQEEEELQSALFITMQTQEAMASAMAKILTQNRNLARSLTEIL